MNAAFLLVTTAWLAGAEPAPTAPPPPAPAPAPLAAPTPGCGSCGGSCGACGSCEEHEGILAKLRARFHRDSCDACAPAAPTCGAHYSPAPTFSGCGCGGEEGPGFLARLRAKFAKEDCGCHGSCGSTCESCGDGPTLFERLRARFHRDSGCDSCAPACGGCGANGIGIPNKPIGEPLKMPKEGDAPKKLPDGKDGKDGKGASTPKELELGAPDKAPEVDNRRPF